MITIMTQNYAASREVIELIRSTESNSRVIIGGVHPTFMPQDSLKDLKPDYLVVGEADHTIREIADSVSRGEHPVSSGVISSDGRVNKYAARDLASPVDRITYDWSMYLTHTPASVVYVPNFQTSRSCVNLCYFCSIHNKGYRELPLQSALDYLTALRTQLREKKPNILFENPTFYADWEYADALTDILADLDVTWVCDTRIEEPSKEKERVLRKAKKSGNNHLFVGIESSLPHVLEDMNKRTRAEDIVPFLKMAKATGITTHAGIMVGFPSQTEEDARKDHEFMMNCLSSGLLDTVYYRFLTIYPGTVYYKRAGNLGIELFHNSDFSNLEIEVTHRTESLSKDDIIRLYHEGLQLIHQHFGDKLCSI